MPEEFSSEPSEPSISIEPPSRVTRGIAPLWHTLLLVTAILAYSFWGAQRLNSDNNNLLAPVHGASHSAATGDTDHLRFLHYGLSGAMELLVVAWVAFGLRLRRIPFRSLFGSLPRGFHKILEETGVAAVFWICSMLVLLAVALPWNVVQSKIYEHQKQSRSQSGSHQTPAPESPQQQQIDMARELMQLAPAGGLEIAAWGLLCLIVGFSEELIFRGYFQSQGIALFGRIPISILLTSLIFGAAHGYQGIRGICLIGVYGALFSIVTQLRRNLFPGMLAHAWHDFATGVALSLIRESHLLDHLPKSS